MLLRARMIAGFKNSATMCHLRHLFRL